MRRSLLAVAGLLLVLLLAACGNKGPLVRAPAHATAPAATPATSPAPAATSNMPLRQP